MDNEKIKDFVSKAYKINNAAYEVMKHLHGGLLESAYECCLAYELQKKGIYVREQVELPLYYDGKVMSRGYRMDLVIDGNIILELKTADEITKEFRQQLFNYMRLTHSPFGMLIDFEKSGRVAIERYVYDEETNYCTGV